MRFSISKIYYFCATFIRMSFRFLGVLLTITFIFSSCGSKRNPEASFYYWKSVFRLSSVEKQTLSQLQVSRLYVKFFDVDWNDETRQALPVAEIRFAEPVPASLTVVPTVFITNRTMRQIPESQLDDLAHKLVTKLTSMMQEQKLTLSEIQLDCDWSGKSRETFFRLVSLVKTKVAARAILLSATIRLHQLKYIGRTGVPPVDKGVLMFYNIGNLDGSNTDNSIMDLTIARQYLRRLKEYPLPLDVALPVYRWAVLTREDRIVNLLTNLTLESLTDTSRYEPIGEKKIRVRQSHYLQSVYLYPGDELRFEAVSPDQLEEAADMLTPIINQPNPSVIFYYLDESTVTRYAPKTLETVVRRFR